MSDKFEKEVLQLLRDIRKTVAPQFQLGAQYDKGMIVRWAGRLYRAKFYVAYAKWEKGAITPDADTEKWELIKGE